ncbi:MAG TPA: DUF4231 domain-containing protein [Bryobacteraceae bacterium]|nr:DUF4231 domain-containing protein [Bryobacteraceae bacterium]
MSALKYPALYYSANTASGKAQKTYLRFFRSTLLLLIFGALLGSVSVTSECWQHASKILSAVLLGISFFLSSTLKIMSPERAWFGARAVAESVKSMSWRYSVGGAPYGLDLPEHDADMKFTGELISILQERRNLAWNFAVEVPDAPQIPPEMRECRRRSTVDRLTLYLRERLEDQRHWYASKAAESRNLHLRWFWAATLPQAAALISAILMIPATASPINPTGAFAAIAAAAMAWVQMKRYQDLAQAYALAAHELGVIQVQAQHVSNEDELSAFVANAENAISREHTMWVARRDVG